MSNDTYYPSMMEEALDGMRRKEIADLKAENERLIEHRDQWKTLAKNLETEWLVAEGTARRQAALLKQCKDALQRIVTPNVVEGTTVGQVILVHNQIAMNALMEIESFEKGTE